MKSFFIKSQILSLSVVIGCSQLLGGTALGASLPLKDPNYQFDQIKLDAAADSFHFLRSYVDYFYLLVNSNRSSLPVVTGLQNVPGWCVGDAHPENFGVLIQQDGRSMFTMNDVDDSGPCPVGLDLIRLMVSSRLYNSDTQIDKIMKAYLKGLARQSLDMPSSVSDMIKKSQKKGLTPSSKKVDGNRIVRDGNMTEVTADELKQIKSALLVLKSALSPQTKLVDVASTSKVGGGSGGLLRYEVLLDNGGTLLHLELKEEVTPAIYPVAAGPIPATADRIAKTIQMDQSANPSLFYTVVQINGRDMLIRPRFDGNVGVSLDKQDDSDNKDIIRYEAYTLGLIHSRSIADTQSWIQQLQSIKQSALEADVALISQHFNVKYSSLK